MKLVIGADHAGFPQKHLVIDALRSWGHDVLDVGAHNQRPVDFPDVALKLSRAILDGRADRGIIVCGTGIGASMATNKIRGIRGALAHDTYSAHQAVEHDNANVLCIGAQVVGPKLMVELLRVFVDARWLPDEEFHRRVDKLERLESMVLGPTAKPRVAKG